MGQWELIFKQMYPAAKVLSVDPAAFRPQLRQKVLGQIQRGDYDGIIMAYSCFEMIPLSEECLMEQLEWKPGELDASLREMRYSPGIGRALEREKVYIKKQIFDLISTLEGYTETVPLTFDQLEINTLFVDEAHNFKNIPLRSNLRKISGINITGSQKCLEMLHKARYVQESNQGRGVVFATGTPLCNSISDTYAMQMYLQYDKMKETHLDRFDNWVKSFAKPERVCEIDVDTSKYRFVLRFARFFNLPELSRLFSQIAAFHAVDDKEGVPRLERYSNELRRLQLLSNNYVHTQEAHRHTITEQEKQLTILNERLAATERNISYVGGISEDGFQAAYQNVKGVLTEDVILGRTASPPELSVLGFGIAIPGVEQQNAQKPYIVLSRNGADYPIDMGPSSAGNARRVVNFLKRFHELPKRIGEQRDECLREIERLKKLSRETNPYLDNMRSLEKEIIQIRSKITVPNGI